MDFDLTKSGIVQGVNGLSYFSLKLIAEVLRQEKVKESEVIRIINVLHRLSL